MQPDLTACLDYPESGKCAGELFLVQGWAFSRTYGIPKVLLRHPSGTTFTLEPMQRPDVGAAFPDVPHAAQSGFSSVEPIQCRLEAGTMEVVVVFDDGSGHVAFRFPFTGPAAKPVDYNVSPDFLRARHESARRRGGLCVLFIDDCVPDGTEGRDDGRVVELLRAMAELGHAVSVLPLREPPAAFHRGALPESVEVLPGYGTAALLEHVAARPGFFDRTLVGQPTTFRRLLRHLDQFPRPLIYDAGGIGAGMDVMPPDVELGMASRADVILAVSQLERGVFERGGCKSVVVVSPAIDVRPTPAAFADRHGMVFLGALQAGSPNAGSIQWFAHEMLPRFDALPEEDGTLTVVGVDTPPHLLSPAGSRLQFANRQPDLAPLMNRARVFVAPTRISARISMNVVTAAAYGVPIVATAQLARELGWIGGEDLLCAHAPQHFAECCIRLMRDEALWQRLRANALARIRNDYLRGKLRESIAAALAIAAAPPRTMRDLPRRKVFVDCGTHYGEGLRELAGKLGIDASWEVHCFEANPACWWYYDRERLLDIPSLTIHRQAVWIEDGFVDVRQEDHVASDSGSPKFGGPNIDGWGSTIVTGSTHPGLQPPVQVPSIDLSRFVREAAMRAGEIILKLDVEGAEYAILRKMIADGSLEYIDRLYVEFHSRLLPSESMESTLALRAEIQRRFPKLFVEGWG